jgi:predicted Zn-dependent protease with MMP-like domain
MARAAADTLAELPLPIRSRLGQVPVFLADRPTVSQIESGIDARALGLFAGPTQIDGESSESTYNPAQITLFVRCLSDAFGLDEDELLDEVRVTVLHELGHYLGLDEDELGELGLG